MNFRKQATSDPPGFQIAPMVDIVFLLLIFFLVTWNFARYETELDVPTFQRKQTGQFPASTPVTSADRRDLLTSGPYGGPNADLNRPTFRRK